MSQEAPQVPITKRQVVYRMPGMDAVAVRRDVVYRTTGAGTLAMDVYLPPDAQRGAPPPAVVLVAGFPDDGMQRVVGCRFREMGSTVSWARLVAASGMAAIAYVNRDPAADARALLDTLRRDGATLGIDGERIGLWASSGNVPLALWLLMEERSPALACAALLYGYTLDLEGEAAVADAAKTYGFANPAAGRTLADLPRDLPLLLARAGADEIPGLNATLDRFARAALARDLPLTLVNHPGAPHAFDLSDDSAASRRVVQQVLSWLRQRLCS